ncbi:hypothetical protein [Methanoregula sp.]|jgi:multicomponent Na+:H+ antiporter subunit F|uniref:hypothetical protein n=1 Tax=Methanoregula sp. TaxID=2052170 RepID=UPI003BB05396
MMVDIWLFAAVCFFILAFCAVLRVVPGPTLNDRLIAVNVAATLACAGALALTVSAGDLIIVLLAGLLACIVFATTIRISQVHRSAAP